MHDSKVGDQGVVHVLPEEGGGVEGVKGDSIRPAMKTPWSAVATHEKVLSYGLGGFYSFSRSSCDFLGIISSI